MAEMIEQRTALRKVTQVPAFGVSLMLALLCSPAQSASLPELPKTLTFVQDIRQLTLKEADSTIPVHLKGVVTYYDPARRFGFIQDETGGMHFVGLHYVEGSPGFDWPQISAGDHLELHGVTARGNFSPFIGIPADSHNALRALDTAPLPEPIRIPVERILNPGHHNQWCELHAILTAVRTAGDRTILELNSGGLQYQGILPLASQGGSLEKLVDTEVRLEGVYGALFNKRRQMVGLEVFVPSLAFIEPTGIHTGHLFDQKSVPIQELLRFRDHSPERVLIQGVVLLQLPNQGVYIRAGGKGLWVETNIKTPLHPGEHVKAVGRPTPGELRPYLSDAIIQMGAKGERPEPLQLEPVKALSPDADGDLIRVTAKLLDQIDLPNDHLMLLESDNITFSIRCPQKPSDAEWPQLINGSWLELTGVCTVKAAGTWYPANPNRPNHLSRTPASFTLLLGDPSDITLLHTPRWWTFERLALLAAAIAVLAMSALIWVGLLRRRVSQQTALIAQTIERESIQEERARIARDLHDTLQQNLTGIMHQMNSTSKRLSGTSGDIAHSFNLTQRMIRHSLDDVRSTIWNLRSQTVHRGDLNTTVQRVLETFQQHDYPDIQLTHSTHSCPLDSVTLHHVVHIVKEAVTNAEQHAQAGRIDVHLDAADSHLTVRVTDNGRGFDVAAVNASKGHFGLLGMKERTAKIHGDLEIHSEPDMGTCVTVTIPLLSAPLPRDNGE